MKKRTRSLSVAIMDCETDTGWATASMSFKEYKNGDVAKRVTLKISDPYDLLYIEGQIAKIRAEWKRVLGVS